MATTTNGYPNNYAVKYYIGPDATSLYALAKGISSITAANSDSVTTYSYLSSLGGNENDLTAKTIADSVVGNRYLGDPAQEFVEDMRTSMDTQAYYVAVEPDGRQMEGVANITNIVSRGGDANARATLSFTVTFQDRPYDFSPEGYDMSSQDGTKTVLTTAIKTAYTRTDPNASTSTTTS